MKPNIQDDCGSCCDHGGADRPFTTFRSRWNFVRNGGGSQRADISSEPWARRWLGKPLHFVWRRSDTASGPRGQRVTDNFARHYVPDFAPRAKRAIYLFMSGAPPQMDLWTTSLDLRLFMIKIFQIPCEARRR